MLYLKECILNYNHTGSVTSNDVGKAKYHM